MAALAFVIASRRDPAAPSVVLVTLNVVEARATGDLQRQNGGQPCHKQAFSSIQRRTPIRLVYWLKQRK